MIAGIGTVASWWFAVVLFIVIPVLLLLNGIEWVRQHIPQAGPTTNSEREVAMMHKTRDDSERHKYTQTRHESRRWHVG